MPTFDQRLQFYEDNYHVLFQGHFGRGRKQYIGNDTLKRCILCNRSLPDVTFKTKAHAIPELLGNRQLILRNECDDCNSYVSRELERHLDSYIRPLRTLSQIRGRSGVPSLVSKDKKSRVDFDPNVGFSIKHHVDSPMISLDEGNKKIVFTVDLEPHIPAAVYKCFVKTALSVLPHDELKSFNQTIKWVMNPDHSLTFMRPLVAYEVMVPGHLPTRGVTLFVLRRKALKSIPYCMMVIAFANLIFQLVVPTVIDAKAGAMTFDWPLFPSPFERGWNYGAPFTNIRDFSSSELVRGVKRKYAMHYGALNLTA